MIFDWNWLDIPQWSTVHSASSWSLIYQNSFHFMVGPPDTGLHAGWMFAIRHSWSPAVRSMDFGVQWFQVFFLGCFTRLSPCGSGEVTSCWQSECFNMFQLLICGKICHRLAPTASSCGKNFSVPGVPPAIEGNVWKCDLWVWERVILCWWIGIPMTTISNKPDRLLTPYN